MGNVNISLKNHVIMPELLVFQKGQVLLLQGIEEGKVFWWTPGAYWRLQKTCDLHRESPESWIAKTIRTQLRVHLATTQLREVHIIEPGHPPILVYTAEVASQGTIECGVGFQRANFFDILNLPHNLGRDDLHSMWLRSLISSIGSTVN